MGRMLRCPFCDRWAPIESYTTLMLPPKYIRQCSTIYKHGGADGCKALFALSLDGR